jgi:5-methylcytosine-specific restriction protein A
MSLKAALERVLAEWQTARNDGYAQHPLATFIRDAVPDELERALKNRRGLTIEGSAGRGRWAGVPWVALFDDVVTNSATRGYYVVYLFHSGGTVVHLSLNQGTTATRTEFKTNTRAVLMDRASLMQRRLADFSAQLPVTSIDLGSQDELPADYCAGHAIGQSYLAGQLPSDEQLSEDLQAAVAAYRALTFRGGLDPSPEADEEDAPRVGSSLIELRRYKMHRRIERNPRAAKEAKKYHGIRCQACNLEFNQRYGHLGDGFIEAHHLRPIASLEEGAAVSYDVATDFAVLCSNCHRMIHRTADPSDLAGFRSLIRF